MGKARTEWALCLAALAALGGAVQAADPQDDAEEALSVEREVERIAGRGKLWPGFDPLAVPLAIYDGERTLLFRHPSPPEGFAPVAGSRPAAWALAGRHPALTANSSAEVGGAVTATLLVDGPRGERPAAELAATAIHEAFHVYQRRVHAGWAGDEGALFLYPSDDARLLGLRRLEAAALRHALAAPEPEEAACWARVALGFRSERFSGLEQALPAYERLTELNEGLATYVQLRAAGKTTVEIPAAEFGPTEVRARAYASGPALAFLLDRFSPGWQARLEADDAQVLDGLLASALGAPAWSGQACALDAGERAALVHAAERDAASVAAARAERKRAFDGRPGWRVVVEAADGLPLWPQGFDPLNVERVDGGVLHARMLRLGNDAGELLVLDEAGADVEALTEGVGPHPLFNGVRRVVVAGMAEPQVEQSGTGVALRAPGLTADFKQASVETSGSGVVVRLGARK